MMLYDNTGVTVELGTLIQNGVNLWNFDYPCPRSVIEYNNKTCTVDFDRKRLEKKIENHYWFRQIGFETVGRFKHYLKTKMNEIMPYYVQLYEFDAKWQNIDDPLESYNLVETFLEETSGTGRASGSNSSESSGSSDNLSKFSDTPQGSVANLDMYLTNATQVTGSDSGTSSGSSEQSSESAGTTSRTMTRKGNIGVQPLGGEVENIRNAFMDIDMKIIEELGELFLKIY